MRVNHPDSKPESTARRAVARPLTYNAAIAERIDVTGALSIFRIVPDALPKKRPWFVAGQYCVLGLNNVGNPRLGAVRRPMSIASAPEAAGPVEFYVRRIARPTSSNPFTHLLWPLGAGDRIYLRTTAAGVFTLRDTIGENDRRFRVMVAAGTGIAPFISMVRSEVCRNPAADLSTWALLHGVSYPSDLAYRDELLRLSATNGLKYWPTVSRPDEAGGWSGDVGRVESFFEPARLAGLEARLGLGRGGFVPGNAAVFVCGLTGTIAGTIFALVDRGFVPDAEQIRDALGVPAGVPHSLFYEHYDPQPVIEVGNPAVIAPLRVRMQTALA